ncbi:hypothetical protein TOI97_03700 [Denitrificimonas sp. JX-1]|uniref:Uncharacterized protein n=1 Tax=Denitrificimonas halotolerans TaxID=3098930 RepID=A0ABU5GP08_9GAMM|nr:hypothetical protein [Denitrificimonas sp. JX-1]MDY7218678.1 hypothetical protein [Denitrificimonas sp. JX-1]
MRQPDIEIYVKDSDRSTVSLWLATALNMPVCTWLEKGRVSRCQYGDIPAVWFEHAVGKWHSLLLESENTPWATDLECAQAAAAYLQVQVRCATGSWQEADGEEDADRWLQVNADTSLETITWYTANK